MLQIAHAKLSASTITILCLFWCDTISLFIYSMAGILSGWSWLLGIISVFMTIIRSKMCCISATVSRLHCPVNPMPYPWTISRITKSSSYPCIASTILTVMRHLKSSEQSFSMCSLYKVTWALYIAAIVTVIGCPFLLIRESSSRAFITTLIVAVM